MKRRSMRHDATLAERLALLAMPRRSWNDASVWYRWEGWDLWELY